LGRLGNPAWVRAPPIKAENICCQPTMGKLGKLSQDELSNNSFFFPLLPTHAQPAFHFHWWNFAKREIQNSKLKWPWDFQFSELNKKREFFFAKFLYLVQVGSQNYKRIFNLKKLSYLICNQIWLNLLIVHHHFDHHIPKLIKPKPNAHYSFDERYHVEYFFLQSA
jgi:hypothetical protein